MRVAIVPLIVLSSTLSLAVMLADCGGNVSEAARRLRMHRRSFQRKISRQPPNR